DGAVLIGGLGAELAGGADLVLVGGRYGDPDVVGAEVGVELAVGMELMAVPSGGFAPALAGRFPDADLREPLSDHGERVPVSGAGEDARQARLEDDLERDDLARAQRPAERNADDGAIVLVSVVGLDEFDSRGEVFAAGYLQLLDVD